MSERQEQVLGRVLHGLTNIDAYDPLRETCIVNKNNLAIEVSTQRRWQYRYTRITGQELLGTIQHFTQAQDGKIMRVPGQVGTELGEFVFSTRGNCYITDGKPQHPATRLIESASESSPREHLQSIEHTLLYDPITASALVQHDGRCYLTLLLQNQHGHLLEVRTDKGVFGKIRLPRGKDHGTIIRERGRHTTVDTFSLNPYIVNGQKIHPVMWLLQDA